MRGRPIRQPAGLLLGIVAVGAVLRLHGLGSQSFDWDETATVRLMHLRLGAMLAAVSDGEATPPLYFVVAWLWAHVAGTGESGLRALSALFGCATVPLAFVLGRGSGATRVAVTAAALTAVSPLLIWYSQEARSYALAALLVTASLVAMVRARDRPSPRGAVAWAGCAVLTMATHYFGAFVVAGEAVVLLAAAPGRRSLRWAVAGVAGAAVPLGALALHQQSRGLAEWVTGSSLGSRLEQLPQLLVAGPGAALPPSSAALDVTGWLAGAIIVLGLMATMVRPVPRRAGGSVLVVAAAAIGLPILLALVGIDAVIGRNLIVALPPLLLAAAVGLSDLGPAHRVVASGSAERRGAWLVAAWAVPLAAVSAIVVVTTGHRRDDWRGAVRALGAPSAVRAIVVMPGFPLAGDLVRHYAPRSRSMSPEPRQVTEVDLVMLRREHPEPLRWPAGDRPNPALRLAGTQTHGDLITQRFVSAVPLTVRARELEPLSGPRSQAASDHSPSTVLVQAPTEPGVRGVR